MRWSMAHKVVEVVTLASLCVCMASCATASFEEIDTSDQEVVDKTCEREYSIDLDDGFNERVSPEDYVEAIHQLSHVSAQRGR